jgi:hypothetical protein
MSGALTFTSTIACIEFNRSSGTWVFDTDVVGNGASGAAITVPSITPSGVGELIVGAAAVDAGTITANSPYTTGPTLTSLGLSEYNLSGSSGAQTINFTQSTGDAFWNSWAGAFK